MLLLVILWQQLLAALSNKQQAQPEPVRARTPSAGSSDQQAFSAAELFRFWNTSPRNTSHTMTAHRMTAPWELTLSGISATAQTCAVAWRADFDVGENALGAALSLGRALTELSAPEDMSAAAPADRLSPEART